MKSLERFDVRGPANAERSFGSIHAARHRGTSRLIAALGILAGLVFGLNFGCATEVLRGGQGTANPDLDQAALSIKLDREDINYLVADYLERLEASRFWREDIEPSSTRPLVAIWPIQNATSEHIDDQLLTLLSSIETSLVNTGEVRVVDRSTQDALVREIQVQQTGAYNPATAQKLGRQLGVQYFFTGKVTSISERLDKVKRVTYSLFLQVLEVETGLVEFQNEVTRTKQVKG